MAISNFTVLSYNIHKGFNISNSEFVLPQIRAALSHLHIDIAFLQEVQGKHRLKRLKKFTIPEEPQTEYLAQNIWPYTVYAKNATYGSAHHGNALLSRFPFEYWENIDVSFAQRASRSLLHGIINFPAAAHELHVICLHLGLFKAERKIQLTVLSDQIKLRIPPEAPLIIAGDFNDWRGHAENHLENELGMQEVYKKLHGEHAKTFPAWRPAFKVDRIYYRGLELLQAHALKDMPWKRLSDHIPLLAEFGIVS